MKDNVEKKQDQKINNLTYKDAETGRLKVILAIIVSEKQVLSKYKRGIE